MAKQFQSVQFMNQHFLPELKKGLVSLKQMSKDQVAVPANLTLKVWVEDRLGNGLGTVKIPSLEQQWAAT